MTLRKSWLVGSYVVAFSIYLIMWLGWTMRWNWVAGVDSAVLAMFYRFGVDRPGWIASWNVLCTVLGPLAFRLVAAALIVVALVRRQWRIAVFLFLSVELAGLVTVAMKAIADRPRPATAMVDAASSSFPSGHALSGMVGVLAISTVLLPMIRPARRRWLVVVGVSIVVLVGVGRVVLNVHNPSDVVAGWALGYVYFSACLLVFSGRKTASAR